MNQTAKHRPFTHCNNVRNVNEALQYALQYMPYNSDTEESRNGPVLVSNTPVITCYSHPTERVLFSPLRDANPFFHLFEAMWMLAGRDDVAYPVLFNSGFGQFSDDDERFWGAYGFRWRHWFGYDQLDVIIQELRNNPSTRRCVLAMWSPGYITYTDAPGSVAQAQPDLMQAIAGGKDVPCNTNVFFRIVDGRLDMMVNCRSNDVFWGAYGANAVHFSFLQEYVATAVGCAVGRYWQNSFNFHVYLDKFPQERFKEYSDDARGANLYSVDGRPGVTPQPLMVGPRDEFDLELRDFLLWSGGPVAEGQHFDEPFLSDTCVPARLAWDAHKRHDYVDADMWCNRIAAPDWHSACKMWINRRWQRHMQKEEGNVG